MDTKMMGAFVASCGARLRAGYGKSWRDVLAAVAALAMLSAPGLGSMAHARAEASATARAKPQRVEKANEFESAFDSAFGTEVRGPRQYENGFERQLAMLANASQGRIGVAAMDLSSGRTIDVLGSQRFPMASTSKVAIAATFLEGVDKGRWSLSSEFPMMMPVASKPFSTAVAPVTPGAYYSARTLIDMMLTRSNNQATDALLRVVGGPRAVNAWIARAGISDWHIDRDIATLVRDDGAVNPASVVDVRDSATPMAMVQLLGGLYQGRWLSASSRQLLFSVMDRCVTGKRRIAAGLPMGTSVAHKTGSLFNTSSDIGIVRTPEGRAYAVAIYVTGQGTRAAREARIASISKALYEGYSLTPANDNGGYRQTASR